MRRYRSLATIQAVQYAGVPIPEVTCDGDFHKHGCDMSRRDQPHVHTKATGGMTCLKKGDWIVPVPGGPFAVIEDVRFRGDYDADAPLPSVAAPEPEPEPEPAKAAKPEKK